MGVTLLAPGARRAAALALLCSCLAGVIHLGSAAVSGGPRVLAAWQQPLAPFLGAPCATGLRVGAASRRRGGGSIAWTCRKEGTGEGGEARPHSFVDVEGSAGRELEGLGEATRYVNAGRRTQEFSTDEMGRSVVNVPVYRASTITFPTLQSMRDPKALYGIEGIFNGFFYGRYGTLTQRSLEDAYAHLQGGYKACCLSTPCAASISAILSQARHGSSVAFSEGVHKDVGYFCDVGLPRLGINPIRIAHDDGGASLAAALEAKPRVSAVYVQGPSPPFFTVPNLREVCERAHRAEVKVIFENSWGACVYLDPFAEGADIVVGDAAMLAGDPYESLGLVAGTELVWKRLLTFCRKWGGISSPDLAYMTLRGVRTLPLRAAQQDETARALAAYLEQRQDVVERVYHPALPSHPTHGNWRGGGYSGAGPSFSFSLRESYRSHESLSRMMDEMAVLKISNAVGGHVSCLWPLSLDPSFSEGGDGAAAGVVLVYAGLEEADAVQADLASALDRLLDSAS